MSAKPVRIIFNPMSGQSGQRARRAVAMVSLLERHGFEASAIGTGGPGDATALAQRAVEEGCSAVIAYGGDGTINEVIQALAQTEIPLGVWAGGTANVVARDLGLPVRMEDLADVIARGKVQRVTLGIARSGGDDAETRRRGDAEMRSRGAEEQGSAGAEETTRRRDDAETRGSGERDRYFLMFAGIGLDASVARSVNYRLKRRIGQFAYWVEGIKHIWSWPADVFSIKVDGKEYESVFALVGKGKGYGGGICLTPDAKLEDPWFQIYVLPPQRNNLAYLRDLSFCMRGKPERSSAKIIAGRHIVANSAAEPLVELDGEVVGALPMSFDVVPDALSILVP